MSTRKQKINKTKKQWTLFSCFVVLLFSWSNAAYAAQMSVTSNTSDTSVGQIFQADVFLDSQGKRINAFSGTITAPVTVTAMQILDGHSITGLWIDRPTASPSGNIIFSGVIPGGYSGKGLLFSVIFRAALVGSAKLHVDQAHVYLDDGRGTEIKPVASVGASVTIEKTGLLSIVPVTVKDTEAPEPFTPHIAQQPTLFDGKWFVSFATQDKSSGIDHYEISEASRGNLAEDKLSWKTATSPYELQDQSLSSFVYVRAIDEFGNSRMEIVPPANPKPVFFGTGEFWGIMIAVLLFGGLIVGRVVAALWRRAQKRSVKK